MRLARPSHRLRFRVAFFSSFLFAFALVSYICELETNVVHNKLDVFQVYVYAFALDKLRIALTGKL